MLVQGSVQLVSRYGAICYIVYVSVCFGFWTLNSRSIKLPLHFAVLLLMLLPSSCCVCLFSCCCLHHILTHRRTHTHLFHLFIRVLFILFNARGNKAKRHTPQQQWNTALKSHLTVAAPLPPASPMPHQPAICLGYLHSDSIIAMSAFVYFI